VLLRCAVIWCCSMKQKFAQLRKFLEGTLHTISRFLRLANGQFHFSHPVNPLGLKCRVVLQRSLWYKAKYVRHKLKIKNSFKPLMRKLTCDACIKSINPRIKINTFLFVCTHLVCCLTTSSISRVNFSNSSCLCCKYCVISANVIAHCFARNSLSNFARLSRKHKTWVKKYILTAKHKKIICSSLYKSQGYTRFKRKAYSWRSTV